MSEFRIVIPLDGSALAEKALNYVHLLKPIGDLRVRLISVLDSYDGVEIGGTYDKWQEVQAKDVSDLSAYLKTHVIQLAEQGIIAESDVRHGATGPEIIADTHDFHADLLVISTHGRTGVARWRFGSIADKVIRGATVNTLVIGPHLREGYAERPIRSVLVPLDGSELAEQALPVAERYAGALGAVLHLVRAVSYPPMAEDPTGFYYSPELLDSIVSGSQTYLANRAAKSGVAATQTSVLNGPAVLELEEYIKAKSIDLVVLTTHGRGGLVRTALGSIADRLIGSVAPVLVVRPSHPS
jgi:nucleotide-binding universal stress UspA family protein